MAPVPPWSQSKACFLFRKRALWLYPWEELAEPPASIPVLYQFSSKTPRTIEAWLRHGGAHKPLTQDPQGDGGGAVSP